MLVHCGRELSITSFMAATCEWKCKKLNCWDLVGVWEGMGNQLKNYGISQVGESCSYCYLTCELSIVCVVQNLNTCMHINWFLHVHHDPGSPHICRHAKFAWRMVPKSTAYYAVRRLYGRSKKSSASSLLWTKDVSWWKVHSVSHSKWSSKAAKCLINFICS